MKSNLIVALFYLTEVVWTRASTAHGHGKEEVSSPRLACSTDYSPFCTCSDYNSGRFLSCTINTAEDFDSLRDVLKTSSYSDYFRVQLRIMAATLDIPKDVLGGKRAALIGLYYPDRSTPAGEIDVDAFQSTFNYTTQLDFNFCNLTNFRFAFLSQFIDLQALGIWDSSLRKISDMPYLPKLTDIVIYNTPDFEDWYSPSTTPNLQTISIVSSSLDDQKMDTILSSMNYFYTYQKLSYLYLYNNALTRVPPLALSFPGLTGLYCYGNPIVTLKTGSINKTYNNLQLLYVSATQLKTIEPGAFNGNFSSTGIHLSFNLAMTSFPSSSFRNLLKSMVGHSGYVDIQNNPINDDCGLAWLLVDNRQFLPYVLNGAIANGTRFEDLNADEYSNCF